MIDHCARSNRTGLNGTLLQIPAPHTATMGHRIRVCPAGAFTTSPSIANGLRIMTYKRGYGTSKWHNGTGEKVYGHGFCGLPDHGAEDFGCWRVGGAG